MPHRFPPPGRSRFNATAFVVLLGLVAVPVVLIIAIVWALIRLGGCGQQS